MSTYGIGLIEGQKLDEMFIRKRPKHVEGPLRINDKQFFAATGGGRAYGCPWGTFVLNSQPIGSIIARLYRRHGINPSWEGYDTVWNVGLPDNITSVGYDVPVKRRRSQIQIHCDPVMKSIGCIVLNKEQFLQFAEEMKDHDNDMAIEIFPAEDGAEFKVFPRPK